MALIVLSSTQSFNSGSDLWVLPDFNHSKLVCKIDWLTNFQLGRLERKTPPKISDELETILQKTEFPRFNQLNITEPLLIPSEQRLPNRWVGIVPFHGDLNPWCKKILKLYEDLNQPSLRIFLPTNLSMNQFTETWRSISSLEDFSLVLEN